MYSGADDRAGVSKLSRNKSNKEPIRIQRQAVVLPKKEVVMTKPVDDYEDDFENYDEDFEENEAKTTTPSSRPVAPAKKHEISPPSSRSPKSRGKQVVSPLTNPGASEQEEIAQLRESIEQENSLARREAKKVKSDHKTDTPTITTDTRSNTHDDSRVAQSKSALMEPITSQKSGARRGSLTKYGSLSIIGGLASMNPRALRIARLHASGVLDMQEIKFTQINLAPCEKMDVYHRLLTSPSQTISQVGVPVEDDNREVEVNTDPIEMIDQQMQFCYDDDTLFLSIQSTIMKRKMNRNEGSTDNGKDRLTLLEEATLSTTSRKSISTDNTLTSSNHALISNDRLAGVLQRSSRVCEILIEEKNLRESGQESRDKLGDSLSFFDPSSTWEDFGTDEANFANELVRHRIPTSIRFSKLQPHLLVASYAYTSHPDDLLPDKVLCTRLIIMDLLSTVII
jgi:hypothetical protein